MTVTGCFHILPSSIFQATRKVISDWDAQKGENILAIHTCSLKRTRLREQKTQTQTFKLLI